MYSYTLFFHLLTNKHSQLTFSCSKSPIETPEKRCEIFSKLTIKTPERRRSGIFIVNFETISYLFLVFLLLTSDKQMLAGLLSEFLKKLYIRYTNKSLPFQEAHLVEEWL